MVVKRLFSVGPQLHPSLVGTNNILQTLHESLLSNYLGLVRISFSLSELINIIFVEPTSAFRCKCDYVIVTDFTAGFSHRHPHFDERVSDLPSGVLSFIPQFTIQRNLIIKHIRFQPKIQDDCCSAPNERHGYYACTIYAHQKLNGSFRQLVEESL